MILPKSECFTRMPMNATLTPQRFYWIKMSDKLAEGIFFTNKTGALLNIQYKLISGSADNDAIWNYNASNKKTEYWVWVNGNVKIDLCHGATNHLCTNPGCSGPGNYMIDISNVKWSSSLTNDENNPSLSNAVPFVIGFDNEHKVVEGLQPPDDVYLRYWLDVPSNTPAYDYNTTYQIMAVIAGDTCA